MFVDRSPSTTSKTIVSLTNEYEKSFVDVKCPPKDNREISNLLNAASWNVSWEPLKTEDILYGADAIFNSGAEKSAAR